MSVSLAITKTGSIKTSVHWCKEKRACSHLTSPALPPPFTYRVTRSSLFNGKTEVEELTGKERSDWPRYLPSKRLRIGLELDKARRCNQNLGDGSVLPCTLSTWPHYCDWQWEKDLLLLKGIESILRFDLDFIIVGSVWKQTD